MAGAAFLAGTAAAVFFAGAAFLAGARLAGVAAALSGAGGASALFWLGTSR